MTLDLLHVGQLNKSFHDGDRELPILRDIDLQVAEHEFVGICGTSGSGKSTLLHCIAGLEPFQSGGVRIAGEDLRDMDEPDRARLRNRTIGFVFQQFHLLPALTALENVMVPLLIASVAGPKARSRAMALLEEVGLTDRFNHRPSQLSGGEQQRVAIARAVIAQPKLLLADEPTGNLDAATGETILRLLLQLGESHHMSLLLVTHNNDLMTAMHRRLELKNAHLYPII